MSDMKSPDNQIESAIRKAIDDFNINCEQFTKEQLASARETSAQLASERTKAEDFETKLEKARECLTWYANCDCEYRELGNPEYDGGKRARQVLKEIGDE